MNERQLNLQVIRGSTRPGRNAAAVAGWVMKKAAGRANARYELIDLADCPLPRLDEPMPPSLGHYAGAHTKAWAAKLAKYDGFVFVTPEYNRSTPGVLKNAIDYAYAEWPSRRSRPHKGYDAPSSSARDSRWPAPSSLLSSSQHATAANTQTQHAAPRPPRP